VTAAPCFRTKERCTMFSLRLRGALASLLALGVFAAALGLLIHSGLAAQEQGGKGSLDGTWSMVSILAGGKPAPGDEVKAIQLIFKGTKLTLSVLGKEQEGSVKIDATKKPKEIDIKGLGPREARGIYRIEQDTLTICFGDKGERPTKFESKPESRTVLMVLKRGAVKVDPATAKKLRLAAQRVMSSNNLKQIALALHNYNDTYRRLPGPALTDKQGKPLLSWRVAILPFVEENPVYKQFKLDEPWDSPHNKKLLKMMPKLYEPVRGKTKEPYTTYYQAFQGPGTAFEPGKMLRIPGDFPDGLSNTIFVVEAGEPVPWTKPEDIPFDPKKKELPKLGGLFPDGFHAAMGDGTAMWISSNFDPPTLRLAIIRNDGQPIDIDKLNPKKQ
jgi:uncharacterized protein (TIGR03067 family)